MEQKEIVLFIHGDAGKPRVVTAVPTEVLREVLIRAELLKSGEEILIFVGECEEALTESDDLENGEDLHQPVDIDLTLEVLGINDHHHIHGHRCRRIAVKVHFGGGEKARKFSPAATVGTVAHWARKKFHLDAGTAKEYVLQLCESTDRPRADVHLGELVKGTHCGLCFDLVKEVTPQG